MSNKLKFPKWCEELDRTLNDAGYVSLQGTPALEFVNYESGTEDEVRQIDDAMLVMFNNGLSPREAVIELEDRDAFHRKYTNT